MHSGAIIVKREGNTRMLIPIDNIACMLASGSGTNIYLKQVAVGGSMAVLYATEPFDAITASIEKMLHGGQST